MNGEIMKDYGEIKFMRVKINCQTEIKDYGEKEAQALRRKVKG